MTNRVNWQETKVSSYTRLFLAWLLAYAALLVAEVYPSDDLAKQLENTLIASRADTKNDSKLQLALQLLSEYEQSAGIDSIQLARGYAQLGYIYDARLDNVKVREFRNQAVDIFRKLPSGKNSEYLLLLIEMAHYEFHLGSRAAADSLYTAACQESCATNFAGSFEEPFILQNFAEYWISKGNRELAVHFLRRALRCTPNEDYRAAFSNRLGNFAQEDGNFAEAENYHRDALELRKRIFGLKSRQVASSLNNLGNVFLARSQYDSALVCYSEGYAICLELAESDQDTKITLLSNLADIAARRGQLEEAARNYELIIVSERDNPNRSLAAYYLNSAANIHLQMGDLDRATELLEEALALRKQVHDLTEAVVPANLADLARVYVERANYQASEELLLEAVASHSRVYNSDHPGLIDYYISLGSLYSDLNRVQDAQNAYLEANRIARIHFGETHDQIAQINLSLAELQLQQDQLSKSNISLAAARKIWQTLFGEQHPSLADAFALEATIKLRSNDPASALISAQRCLDMREELLDSMHPAIAESWSLLAEVQLARANYVAAFAACANAEAVYQSVLGQEHPTLAGLCELRAKICLAEGKQESAFRLASKSVELRSRHLRQNAVAFSERDGLLYSDKLREARNLMLGCFFSYSSPTSSDSMLCAQLVVKTKALVTQDIAMQRRNYRANDARYDKLIAQIQHARSLQMREFIKGPQGNSVSKFKKGMDSLRTVIEVKEKELARLTASEESLDEPPADPVTAIQPVLSDTTLVVEFIKYIDPINVSRYAAITIARSGMPRIIDLGSVKSIDSLIGQYTDHFETISKRGYATAVDVTRYRAVASTLYDRILKRCLENDREPTELIITADGNLNLLSFAALVSDSGRYLIESTRVSYLSSARELLNPVRKSPSSAKSLLAIGDPDFNTLDGFAPSGGEISEDDNDGKIAYRSRGLRSTCLNLAATQLIPLPSAGRELRAIDQQWRSGARGSSELLLGAFASEERFKADCLGKFAIHIATHGYAFGADCAGIASPAYGHSDPLLNTGVFLAGANQALMRIQAGQEDGILMASEVLSLDLRATDLVVLSSCMSGRGEVFDGEGVFGLRRAFLLAGAKSVVSSLWSIPDIETAELMQSIYQSVERNFSTALCNAQRKRLDDLRSDGRIDHPFSWGGFLLTKSGP